MGYRIERFDGEHHDRTGFRSGEPTLDTYFARQARQDVRRDLNSLFCLREDNDQRVIGFYTLCASSVPLKDIPADMARGLPSYADIPAFLLGRLAVDVDHRRMGHGEVLLFDALARSAGSPLAAWCVVVDALDTAVAGWYGRYGFRALPHQPLRMILPVKTIRTLTPVR